jgi:DNA-binding response OmpR family regulator
MRGGEWVHRPANAEEMHRLAERLEVHDAVDPPTPRVDRNGILRFRGRLVPLSPVEERIARVLIDAPGSVVSRSRLVSDRSEMNALGLSSLRTRMTRLRRRIEPLGLTVRSVRGHGYIVEPSKGNER